MDHSKLNSECILGINVINDNPAMFRAGTKIIFELPKTAWSISMHLGRVWWLDTEFPSTIFWRPLNSNGTILWSDLQDPDSFEP